MGFNSAFKGLNVYKQHSTKRENVAKIKINRWSSYGVMIMCNITGICLFHKSVDGPGSSVGIATGYGLDDPGIESRWGGGKIFRTCPDRPWGPPSLLYNGYRAFPGGKERPGRDADPSPSSSAVGH